MGNGKQYNPEGGFSEYLYKSASEKVTINGVTGKMIEPYEMKKNGKYSLPTYSNTCDVYFKKGEEGLAVQAKVYISREMVLDFDWDHDHRNKSDGRFFPTGTVHVQIYKKDTDGKLKRLSDEARNMTQSEIDKYGEIIHYFNPHVKF